MFAERVGKNKATLENGVVPLNQVSGIEDEPRDWYVQDQPTYPHSTSLCIKTDKCSVYRSERVFLAVDGKPMDVHYESMALAGVSGQLLPLTRESNEVPCSASFMQELDLDHSRVQTINSRSQVPSRKPERDLHSRICVLTKTTTRASHSPLCTVGRRIRSSTKLLHRNGFL